MERRASHGQNGATNERRAVGDEGRETVARGDGIMVYRGGHKWDRGRGHRVPMDGEQKDDQ